MNNEILNRLKRIVCELFNVASDKELPIDTDLVNDLMADSLTLITMVVEVETEFDILFPDTSLSLVNLRDYRWLCEKTEELCNAKG